MDHANKKTIELRINQLNRNLLTQAPTELQQEKMREELQTLLTQSEDIEKHLAQCASVRARQEWDINVEGPGKILLKCKEKLGQQKYMSSTNKRNEQGEIIETITGQDQVEQKLLKSGKQSSQLTTYSQLKKT